MCCVLLALLGLTKLRLACCRRLAEVPTGLYNGKKRHLYGCRYQTGCTVHFLTAICDFCFKTHFQLWRELSKKKRATHTVRRSYVNKNVWSLDPEMRKKVLSLNWADQHWDIVKQKIYCLQQHIYYLMQSGHYGPKYLNNILETLLKLCHKQLRQF